MSDIEWTINVKPSRLYRLRMLLPREGRALIRRLEMAVEYGVLTTDEAWAVWRREAPLWFEHQGNAAIDGIYAAAMRRIDAEYRAEVRRIEGEGGRP